MTKLFRYQKRGEWKLWKFLKSCGAALLADDMGLGKTIQVLTLIQKRLKKPRPIVVVCPATARDTWVTQASEHIKMRAVALYGKKPHPDDVRRLRSDRRVIYVLSYDVVRHWWRHLANISPVLVVPDEAQRLKNSGAKWTKAVRDLQNHSKYRVFVGGTGGVEKSPLDIWPILSMACHDSWPRRWRRLAKHKVTFIKRFCIVRKTRWGKKIEGGKNLDQLHRFMKSRFMVRRRTVDVLKDLPPLQRHVVQVPLTPKKWKEYLAAETEAMDEFEKLAYRKDKDNVQQRSLALGLLKTTAELKLDAVKEWIDEFLSETGEKLLVFGWNKSIVQGLHKHYGDKAVRIDGSVTGVKRKLATDRFNFDPSCRLCFGNIKAAGESWSCKSASTELFVQMFPNPAVHNQAEKRCHGVGRGVRGKHTRVFYLVAKDTAEERLVKKLHKEQKVIDGIIDGGISSGGFDQTKLIREIMTRRSKHATRPV